MLVLTAARDGGETPWAPAASHHDRVGQDLSFKHYWTNLTATGLPAKPTLAVMPERPIEDGVRTTDPTPNPLTGDAHWADLTALLTTLDAGQPIVLPSRNAAEENKLPLVRLGIANGLFTSLRLRHAPTADHSLRVAMICSHWAQVTEMAAEERDELEVAALLHDIGKIGVPDPVLKKPSALSPEQAMAMRQATPFALRILSDCCQTPGILEAIQHVHEWFDGSDGNRKGTDIPLSSRMIAIADAFDAMTTDRVYRKALPRERAIAELFESSGTQFDPTLVAQFATLQASHGNTFSLPPSQEWLSALAAGGSNRHWGLQVGLNPSDVVCRESLFFASLVASSRDAVIFLDSHLSIIRWNQAAEILTGISSDQIVDCCWHPKLVGLKHADGVLVSETECPIIKAARDHVRMSQLVNITTRQGDVIPIEVNTIPVSSHESEPLGSVIVFHDKTSEQTWRAQIESLNDQVARDGLTGVANRAEFDRFHQQAIAAHIAQGTACSLIICDIDRFKRINDELGHQAGDAALVNFAGMLTQCCREGDLVARYGGEEFVIVCNDCGASEASQLAEKIRATLEATQMPELGGRSVTASFGVTELQQGDDAETMLRRADRGLLQAKETGRNKVVELGTGMQPADESSKRSRSWWTPWGGNSRLKSKSVEKSLLTNVPMNLVAQKLHGFISDKDANVLLVEPQRVQLQVTSSAETHSRRSSDRPITFNIELGFRELADDTEHPLMASTVIDVKLSPLRVRDRRQRPEEVAEQLLSSLRSYLMAHDYNADH